MFQTKGVDKIETHFTCHNVYSENRAVYEIIWEKYGRAVQTSDEIRRMRITCWIPETMNTH
jgi:hypothetical protein